MSLEAAREGVKGADRTEPSSELGVKLDGEEESLVIEALRGDRGGALRANNSGGGEGGEEGRDPQGGPEEEGQGPRRTWGGSQHG